MIHGIRNAVIDAIHTPYGDNNGVLHVKKDIPNDAIHTPYGDNNPISAIGVVIK